MHGSLLSTCTIDMSIIYYMYTCTGTCRLHNIYMCAGSNVHMYMYMYMYNVCIPTMYMYIHVHGNRHMQCRYCVYMLIEEVCV